MDIPDDLNRELRNRRKKDQEIDARQKKEKEKRDSAYREVERLRVKDYDKLMKLARYAAKWANDFFKDKRGKEMIGKAVFVYGLILFSSDKFFRGLPLEKPDVGARARVLIKKNGELVYHEQYKWFPPSDDVLLGKVPVRAELLIAELHPDYLKAFVEHLKSGKVWETIKQEIK